MGSILKCFDFFELFSICENGEEMGGKEAGVVDSSSAAHSCAGPSDNCVYYALLGHLMAARIFGLSEDRALGGMFRWLSNPE